MTPILQKLLDRAVTEAQITFDKEGIVVPFIVGYTGDDKIRHWTLPDKTTENKNAMALYFKIMLHYTKSTAYVLVSEAWALRIENISDEERKQIAKEAMEHGISNHPLRYEAIHYVIDDGKECYAGEQGIIRPAGGKAIFDEIKIDKLPKPFEGRFTNLLKMNDKEMGLFKEIEDYYNRISNIAFPN